MKPFTSRYIRWGGGGEKKRIINNRRRGNGTGPVVYSGKNAYTHTYKQSCTGHPFSGEPLNRTVVVVRDKWSARCAFRSLSPPSPSREVTDGPRGSASSDEYRSNIKPIFLLLFFLLSPSFARAFSRETKNLFRFQRVFVTPSVVIHVSYAVFPRFLFFFINTYCYERLLYTISVRKCSNKNIGCCSSISLYYFWVSKSFWFFSFFFTHTRLIARFKYVLLAGWLAGWLTTTTAPTYAEILSNGGVFMTFFSLARRSEEKNK